MSGKKFDTRFDINPLGHSRESQLHNYRVFHEMWFDLGGKSV